MGKLKITKTPLEGLYVIETEPFLDHRGAFARWFCEAELSEIVGIRQIKNVNFCRTAKAGCGWMIPYSAFPGSLR